MTATTELETLMRNVETDFDIYRTTLKVLRDVHKHEEGMCASCGSEFPCKTVRVMDNAQSILDLSPLAG